MKCAWCGVDLSARQHRLPIEVELARQESDYQARMGQTNERPGGQPGPKQGAER